MALDFTEDYWVYRVELFNLDAGETENDNHFLMVASDINTALQLAQEYYEHEDEGRKRYLVKSIIEIGGAVAALRDD